MRILAALPRIPPYQDAARVGGFSAQLPADLPPAVAARLWDWAPLVASALARSGRGFAADAAGYTGGIGGLASPLVARMTACATPVDSPVRYSAPAGDMR